MGRKQIGTKAMKDGTKVCSKCLSQKTVDEFNKGPFRDGLDPHCKACKRAARVARKAKRSDTSNQLAPTTKNVFTHG